MEEDNIFNKANNLKLEDLYSKKGQVESNRIFIEENNEMIPYIVITNDYNENALLLREFLLDEPMRFNPNGWYSAYYEDSEIDIFLNGEFYESLSDVVKSNIIDSTIEITDKNSLGISGKDTMNITRKLFLLSYHEMNGSSSRINLKEGIPLPYFSDKSSRIAYYNNGKAGGWWLRTPSSADTNIVNGISISGAIGVSGIAGAGGEYLNGVRPAFSLDGDLNIVPRRDILEGEIVYVIDLSN